MADAFAPGRTYLPAIVLRSLLIVNVMSAGSSSGSAGAASGDANEQTRGVFLGPTRFTDDGTRRSGTSLAYLFAAMVVDTFASLAALVYSINLWVDGEPDVPRSPSWWNPFRHPHLLRGPVHPWTASALLIVCAGLGVMASRRATSAPRTSILELTLSAIAGYAATYFTNQPLVLWGLPLSLAYIGNAVLVRMSAVTHRSATSATPASDTSTPRGP